MSQTTHDHHAVRREVWREAVTMALYLSLSLLAVLLATGPITTDAKSEVVKTLLLTALGLLVAHLVAFAVSSRLVSRGQLDSESRDAIGAQIAAGLVVAVLAVLPTLILGPDVSLQVTEFLLLAFVCAVGYLAARQAGGSKVRAVAYSGVVFFLAIAVLLLKSLVGH